MPLHEVVGIKCAFEYLGLHIELQSQLNSTIAFFKREIEKNGLETKMINSSSAIQALIFPGNAEVKNVAKALQEQKLNVKPILSPTVKLGQERLRICLHTYNHHADIKFLVDQLSAFK